MTRLRRSDPGAAGLTRARHGRGFRYLDARGEPVDAATLTRIKELVIPPAWREVWICPHPNGHIQAVGVDEAGRRQYLYHPAWTARRDAEKFDRVLRLAARLPKVRTRIAEYIEQPGLGRERVLAAALRLLELGAFRVGGHSYAKENGSYGLATLRREHVALRKGRIHVCYLAKSGQQRELSVADDQAFSVVRGLLRREEDNPELFAYRNGQGWRNVRAEEVNEFLRELAGDGFSAKDLRTWNATVLAATALGAEERPASKTGRKRAVAGMVREVAEEIGNTPAVCRRSYIDPHVIDAYDHGLTIRPTVLRIRSTDLTMPETRDTIERSVLRLLRKARRELG
ncbi:DNA topoisomerase IB [Crossiella sp. SN42]|uniref:DNA topoisomerase IB n=1 Tax=Crossiella sp. SN42 TaxID=2944808 RepID=UPI00207C4D20|nr:DNA topoisomerase IB [Crossiella sp. SN42]MCO1581994.1 DNA topoisomerase IB [Crossiella sp. SN42]